MTGVRRIDQGMAEAAAGLLPEDVSDEMRTRYRQLRIMLHTAGLAATYAFVAAKAGDRNELAGAYQKARDGIAQRLSDTGLLSRDAGDLSVRDVLGELGKMNAVQYARASAEIAALAGWLSRLADAVSGQGGPAAGARIGRQGDAGGRQERLP